MADLVSDPDAIAWECRGAWATGRRVSLSLEGRGQLVGLVRAVAATGAYVILATDEDPDGIHVPLYIVEAVHRPHFHSPATWRPRAYDGDPDQQVIPGQLPITSPLPVSLRAADAMMRASRMMLQRDLLEVLAATDRAGRHPSIEEVAAEVGRSSRWASKRLRALERMGFLRCFTHKRKKRFKIES